MTKEDAIKKIDELQNQINDLKAKIEKSDDFTNAAKTHLKIPNTNPEASSGLLDIDVSDPQNYDRRGYL